MSKQKLELTWIGKEKRPKLEPRILLEDPDKSHHARHRVTENDIFDNRLIFGDNLLALKALEQEFYGRIKCIYIDPPFNTGQAFEHYDDGLEHSLWLSLMRDRLFILHRLLSDDGLFWIQLDDNEVHYCKVILDEIFGRQNFISHITYERSGAAGLGLGGFVVSTGESILLYKKNQLPRRRVLSHQLLDGKTMKRYNKALVDSGTRTLVREFESKSNGELVKVFRHTGFAIKTISLAKFEEREEEIRAEFADNFEALFRTNQIQKENQFQRDLVSSMDKSHLYTVDYVPSRGKHEGKLTTLYYHNAELFAWLKDTAELSDGQITKSSSITNVWAHSEIPKADIASEGGVDFPRSKKPEQLLRRIIDMSTEPGDWVLDSFAGSGTTGATAHKMGRRWIMVELGEHCHTHVLPRMRNVIDGADSRGISSAMGWKGGGGFRYFRLAPSLIVNDRWGNPVINPEYNAAQLAEALAKLEGFNYAPSEVQWWQHGHSSERDFIYVTTQNLSADQLEALSEEVGSDRSLLVCCSAFRGVTAAKAAERWPNLTLKKIPKMVLARCEWGHDDYSLNVANLPMAKPDPVESPAAAEANKKTKSRKVPAANLDQGGLFGENE
ncbi:TPA: site-specific DNA-methyltransferase [Pseudomonas aeruginosa]